MKPEVLQTLLTAKVLLGKAQELCFVEDKFSASSGLIILQDAIELIFLAALIGKGVDEQKKLEDLKFDQLIDELKKQGINGIKSVTLKALNKQRVLIKHYGQPCEPQIVANYYTVVHQIADNVLEQVVGKRLDQIVLNELIRNEETNKYLTEACEALEQEKYFDCLTSIRKAIFIEIEWDYCISELKDFEANEASGFRAMRLGGWKSPYYTRNRAWIEQNVNDPFDYIQIDHDQIRQDLLEWGASTQDFWNIWRLTPTVMRLSKEGDWLQKGELKHLYRAATKENAIFCLDRAVTLLLKKQSHLNLARSLGYTDRDQLKVRIKKNSTLYEKASSSSAVLTQLTENSVYDADSVVPGMDGNGQYVNISHVQYFERKFLSGYVDIDSCNLLQQENGDS